MKMLSSGKIVSSHLQQHSNLKCLMELDETYPSARVRMDEEAIEFEGRAEEASISSSESSSHLLTKADASAEFGAYAFSSLSESSIMMI